MNWEERPLQLPHRFRRPPVSNNRAQRVSLQHPRDLQAVLLVVVFWMWVAAGDWVNKDSQIYGLGYQKWSLIFYVPFLLAA